MENLSELSSYNVSFRVDDLAFAQKSRHPRERTGPQPSLRPGGDVANQFPSPRPCLTLVSAVFVRLHFFSGVEDISGRRGCFSDQTPPSQLPHFGPGCA